MKYLLASVVIAASGAAWADGAAWEGAYAGATFNQGGGGQEYCPCVGTVEYDLVGDMAGIFGGYNMSSGSLVYGAEVAASFGAITEDGFPDYQFTNIVDLKGRVGYDLGTAMVYGTLGYSTADWDQSGTHSSSSGMLLGFGVDVMVGSNVIIGVEMVSRDLHNATEDFDATLETLTLRAGYSF